MLYCSRVNCIRDWVKIQRSLKAVLFKGQLRDWVKIQRSLKEVTVFTEYRRLLGTIIIFEWGSHMKKLCLNFKPITMYWKTLAQEEQVEVRTEECVRSPCRIIYTYSRANVRQSHASLWFNKSHFFWHLASLFLILWAMRSNLLIRVNYISLLKPLIKELVDSIAECFLKLSATNYKIANLALFLGKRPE